MSREENPSEVSIEAFRPPAHSGQDMAEGSILGGRYEIQRVLKKGQGTETLLARDRTHGTNVVIKTAAAASFTPTARMRWEHEATVLRQIKIAPTAPLLDHGCADGLLYLVMPVAPGVPLRTRLRQGALSVTDTIAVGRSLLSVLREAHAHGVLHRAVTPANVMVEEAAPIQSAVLIDFGLMHSVNIDVSVSSLDVGDAQYMSPEAAGLLDQEVTECSDLYSVGIVLFECLAKRPPFQGERVGEVLRLQMAVQPPELRSLGLSIPRALDEVVQRLLRKDPRDRYQSAEAVVADLTHIAEALRQGQSEPAIVIGHADRRRTLTEPAFVGRDEELAALDALWTQTQAGNGGLVMVEALSGGGKTRLLVELALRCAQKGAWVLRGQGVDQAAQRPFQVLTGVAESLIAAAHADPALAERIRTELADQSDAVAAALPELAEILGAGAIDRLGPETFGETRSVQALTALLDGLGVRDRPALVLLDDCQWADQLTLKVIEHRRRRSERGRGNGEYLLVVVSFRSEEVAAGHVLRTAKGEVPAAHLTLPAFQAADVRQLVESMAGPLPEETVGFIEQFAEGSPFMASAALRGLVESGALAAAPEGWRVEATALAEVQSSRHAAAFLARRIDWLPEETVRLISVGAVLGKEFDLATAAKLAGQSSTQAITALDAARHRHIVWTRGQDGRCAFVHDKLRETLLARLPKQARREVHLRVALELETQTPAPVFELAHHFDAAGESKRALAYALAAAEQARAQHSLEIAEQQYRIAGRGAANADRGTRYRIAEGLGDVLMLRGRYEDALGQTEAARELAEGDFAKAKIEGKRSEIAFKKGDMKAAIEANERALELLGNKVPRWSVGYFFRMAREAFVQVLHTWLPALFLGRRKLEGAEVQLLTARLHSRLAYCYWFGKGKIPCLWTHLRGMNLAEKYPPTLELAHAYSTHAPVISLVPAINRGIAYAQKSFAICKSLGDLWGQGQALHFHGLVLSVGSRFEECIEKCREGVRLMERTGDVWEVNIAQYHIAHCLYRLGDLPAAVAMAKRIHQSGLDLGDIQATGICLHVWVQASGGRVNPELVQVELRRVRADIQTSVQVMLAEGVRLYYLDRVEEAAALFEQGHQYSKKTGVANAWTFALLPWLASALRRQAEKTSPWVPERRRVLLTRALQVAKQALKVARTFQNDLPHALREAGLIARMRGSNARSRKYLEESLLVAQRQDARFEHAQSLLALGRIGVDAGWPGAKVDVVAAEHALHALGADFVLNEAVVPETSAPGRPATLSLADRFDAILEAGRKIAAARSRQDIFQEVRDAVSRLLRGERCLLFRREGDDADDGCTRVSSAEEAEYSRGMSQRAYQAGRVIVDGQADSPGETAMLAGVRSALCAPIFVRGLPAGCFYVDHRHVSGLFGEDEKRLAEFIATAAGSALENAEGFAILEERVADRAAAAEARSQELARSNAELELFASVASHDLQEPLRMVASYMELLATRFQGKLDEKANRWIDFAVGGVVRMKQLINDLLEFSRVGTRGKPFKPVDCATIFEQIRQNLRTAIRESGAEVTSGPLPTVHADETQIGQVLQNLIANAIKFSGDAAPTVRVEAEREEEGWRFFVRDNGIGIDPQFAERIFVIFQRLHTREEYPGTGIGLAIVKKIIDRHGGRVWFESQPGQGTTFFFTLPDLASQDMKGIVGENNS